MTIRGHDDTWYLIAIGLSDEENELFLPLTMQAAGSELLMGDGEQFSLVGDGVVLTLGSCDMIVAALAANL